MDKFNHDSGLASTALTDGPDVGRNVARRMIVVGSRRHGEDRIMGVQVLIDDAAAGLAHCVLTPDQADDAAREMVKMAALIRDGWRG